MDGVVGCEGGGCARGAGCLGLVGGWGWGVGSEGVGLVQQGVGVGRGGVRGGKHVMPGRMKAGVTYAQGGGEGWEAIGLVHGRKDYEGLRGWGLVLCNN